ncbi:MAG: calcium-translocating P-type ATPase, PMCA-type [Clostridia bacterium]|nr:calcium-translocating P-type ATPase, PMCA-type [Clostridia bacterium]
MWHMLKTEEVLRRLQTSTKIGLAYNEIESRKEKYGANKLQEKKKENIVIKFIKQFNDFMIIILIIASIISAFTSYMQGENDYVDSIIIIAIVILNAIMGLVQEARAEKSIESLKKLTPQIAKVIREGKIQEINAEELVPGDIIELEAGNYVPADCRIIEGFNLKIEESSLTGETEPVEKSEAQILEEKIPLGDMKNMGFMASIVVSGHGKAIVTDTGMNTKIGKIANMINEEEAPETPIQKKLSEVGKTLGIVCLVICAIIYVIGILKKIEPIEMFMTSVGLAVAAIPEGLPAIVTIMLSIGVTKMARKNSIIRKLPAVETLGCSNVICSDKTGTLTQNKMTVVKTISDDEELLLKLGCMCTDCDIKDEKEAIGEPTEVAIVNNALLKGINKKELYNKMNRISEIPFDSNRKLMTTIHRLESGYRSITKGAPDVMINKCDRIYRNGKIERLSEEEKRKIQNQNTQLADDALRVIAVGYRDFEFMRKDVTNLEENLIFVGLIGMIDPPREGVKEAVRTCKKAGIKTVMITGDHIATAKAIAKELGILEMGDMAITGADLDNISDNELTRNISSYSVFARVTPEHKVRIVKAWQKTGAVVAMTGDGVNDSPALKNADIGIAMGKGGTDVAKNASDMVLMDDNFVTIVQAIRQGRNIFDNIKKAIHFLIATNIGEITTIFIGLLLGLQSPLLAIQLLWINLVTDSLPAIALGLEKDEKGIMERKPRNSKKSIFADGLWSKIITEGIMLGVLDLFIFSLGNNLYGIDVARTMAFVALGLLELVHSFNIKSEGSILKKGALNNKFLIGSFILGTLLQVIVVIIPYFANIFSLVTLNQTQWLYTIIISFLPLPIIEMQKLINKIRFKNNVEVPIDFNGLSRVRR